jgi:phosphopantothenoylcysteine decarboxylase/phosphopantothenate--cysteine ligase
MYLNPATQANLRTLEARGISIIAPGEGELASHGERGVGRLPEPVELLATVEGLALSAPPVGADLAAAPTDGSQAPPAPTRELAGMRVLVTAGGTREPIDSVRFVGNRSSGRMGLALAMAAAQRGAEVSLILANVSLPAPAGTRVLRVETAAELAAACLTEFPSCDALLMTAAVADFRPAHPASHKLKKDGPEAPGTIALEPTEDVLATLAALRRPGQVVVGFAAEHGEGAAAHGREKLVRKGLDVIVINDISRPDIGFDSDQNEVLVLTRDGGGQHIPRMAKAQVAGHILNHVRRLREAAASAAVNP